MSDRTLSPEEVSRYLRAHPDFFHSHQELLETLSLPHPQTGNAISLIERQLHQFREQRDRFQVEVETMLDIAGENGQLFQRVMQLNSGLMASRSEEEAVRLLHDQLRELFRVDQSVIHSFDMPFRSVAGIRQLGMSAKWTAALSALLTPKTPFCGALEKEWRQGLFEDGESIHSVCILPLGEERIWGILVLGSHDLRFENDFGHFFLRMICEMVDAKLKWLFNKEAQPLRKPKASSGERAKLRVVEQATASEKE